MPERSRVLIVDDEPLARRGLRRLLEEREELEVVGECRNGREAIERLASPGVDLVLLDVEMPLLNGIEVVEALGVDAMPAVIFVTAHDRYALQAFEAHAIDYVLKPIESARFHGAIDRAVQALATQETQALQERLNRLLADFEQRQSFLQRLVIREGSRVHVVPLEEVDWIESADNYVRVHRADGYLLQRETLTRLEARLDPLEFVRIHRSTIVRVDRIRQILPQGRGDSVLVLEGGRQLNVSRRYRSGLDALLER